MIVGNALENRLDMRCGGMSMQRLTSAIAIAATVALGVLSISTAAAADAQGGHHHRARHHAGAYGPYVTADPAVRDGYVMNGAFDWRPLHSGHEMPWYAHGYSNDCVAWTRHAYHYACDPNNRY
jgi:hypothetical protein